MLEFIHLQGLGSSQLADHLANEINQGHELQTPNEGINQRNLKIWADGAGKICFDRT